MVSWPHLSCCHQLFPSPLPRPPPLTPWRSLRLSTGKKKRGKKYLFSLSLQKRLKCCVGMDSAASFTTKAHGILAQQPSVLSFQYNTPDPRSSTIGSHRPNTCKPTTSSFIRDKAGYTTARRGKQLLCCTERTHWDQCCVSLSHSPMASS